MATLVITPVIHDILQEYRFLLHAGIHYRILPQASKLGIVFSKAAAVQGHI